MDEIYSFKNDRMKEILLFIDIAEAAEKEIMVDTAVTSDTINGLLNQEKFSNIEIEQSFSKVAFILLMSKFEHFIETFLETYAQKKIDRNNFDELNSELSRQIINGILAEIEKLRIHKSKQNKIDNYLEELTIFVSKNTNTDLTKFKKYLETKFRYGKHGGDELKNLVKKFGFKECVDSETGKAFIMVFNNLTNIRNNIIHADTKFPYPSEELRKYLNNFIDFSDAINEEAIKDLEKNKL
ncbi:MAG: hypothetical protein EAZ85_04265 [Bacteroidetes bacterium]|nr:MAG: hypothetical protein EAZ85_04265 [Bacteroidota bacterium]